MKETLKNLKMKKREESVLISNVYTHGLSEMSRYKVYGSVVNIHLYRTERVQTKVLRVHTGAN